MKKRLLFLFSLLLLVGNVVAQNFDTSAKYRIKVSDGSAAGEYVTIGDNLVVIPKIGYLSLWLRGL